MNIEPYFWHLWAVCRRNGFAKTGYYSQQPWFTPAPLGEVMSDPRDVPNGDDFSKADSINAQVQRLKNFRPNQVKYLEIYEGAYMDAEPDRESRFTQMQVKPATCRREANKAKRWVKDHI